MDTKNVATDAAQPPAKRARRPEEAPFAYLGRLHLAARHRRWTLLWALLRPLLRVPDAEPLHSASQSPTKRRRQAVERPRKRLRD